MTPFRNPFMLPLVLAVILAIATGFLAFKLFESAEADIQSKMEAKVTASPPPEQQQ